jgi:phosphate transport system substrate-binding protein
MNKKIKTTLAVFAALALLTGTATSASATSIAGSGSSFAYNGVYKCASLYEAHNVTYASTGSGTGRSNFMSGGSQFAVSDGIYSVGTEPNGYTMVPLFGGPVVFAYNKYSGIPSNLNLTGPIVSGILKGAITKWNDAKIKKVNVGKKLPNLTIKVFYRSGSSGTNQNLSRYLQQAVGGWTENQTLLTASTGGLRAGAISKATSSLLADAVESRSNLGAFGYFDLSDAKTANVYLAKLKNKHGEYVAPTSAAGALFLNSQSVITASGDRTDGTMSIDFNKSVKNAYQLTIVTYGIGGKAKTDASSVAVEDYFKFVISTCMPAQASRLGYVALTGSLKAKALAQAAAISQ